MATSFRDRLKASNTGALKKSMEEEEAKIPSGGGNSEFLKLAEGINKLRAFPGHPDGGEDSPFIVLKSSIWLTVENQDGKAGRRTFQNTKIHLNTKHDLAEEYIIAAKAKLTLSKKAEDAKKLKDMTTFAKGNDATLGYGNTWLMYAKLIAKSKEEKLGLIELKKTVRDAIKTNSIIEDEDEAIEVDPFTDPESGKPMIITYTPNPPKGSKNYYQFQVSKNAMPLTDEEVEWFERQKPLQRTPQVRFKAEDFDLVLEGLRNYDDEYEIGVFETDSFEKMIETCREEVEAALTGDDDDTAAEDEEETPKKSTKGAAAKKTTKKSAQTDEEEEEEPVVKKKTTKPVEDEFTDMDRDELKAYNKANSLGISVKTSMSDEDLRVLVRAAAAETVSADEEEEPEEEEAPVVKKSSKKEVQKEEEEEDTDNSEEEEEPVVKKKVNIADLKKKLLGNKK